MPSLMDALAGQMSQLPPTQTGGGQNTQQVQAAAQAMTGKAAAGTSSPKMVNIGEGVAAGAANAQLHATQQTGEATGAHFAGIADKQAADKQAQSASLDSQRTGQIQKYSDQVANLSQELTQSKGQLDADKQANMVEQIGFFSRLSNDAYVTQLQQAGDLARLGDDAGFREALAKTTFGDDEQLFAQKMSAADLLNMSDNDFKKELANMDLDFAVALAKSDAQSANTAAMAQGVGGLVTGGVQAYAVYKKNSPDGGGAPDPSANPNGPQIA